MTGTDKWPRELDGVIREEIVKDRLRPVEVWQRVVAGTLVDGLDPIAVPKRTFYYRWTRAQREFALAQQRKEDGPSFLDQMRILMLDDWTDRGPEDLAEELDLSVAYVSDCLDAIAERHTGSERAQIGGNP